MGESKIQFKIGNIEFSGEGAPDWVSSQVDKILEKVPELMKIKGAHSNSHHTNIDEGVVQKEEKVSSNGKLPNFSVFLSDKSATVNQIRKFLATAAYIQLGGKNRISTSDISGAIKKYNQSRLGNPSDSLNQNVRKGYCEKDGKEFYVTDEGLKELGIV